MLFNEIPTTLAPSNFSHAVSQEPLNPVWPVIITFLFLKVLVSKRMTVDNEIYSNYINKYIVSSNKEYTNKYSYEVIYKS